MKFSRGEIHSSFPSARRRDAGSDQGMPALLPQTRAPPRPCPGPGPVSVLPLPCPGPGPFPPLPAPSALPRRRAGAVAGRAAGLRAGPAGTAGAAEQRESTAGNGRGEEGRGRPRKPGPADRAPGPSVPGEVPGLSLCLGHLRCPSPAAASSLGPAPVPAGAPLAVSPPARVLCGDSQCQPHGCGYRCA